MHSLVPSPLPAAIFNGAEKVVWHFKSKSLALVPTSQASRDSDGYYVCTCLIVKATTEVLVFSHVRTLQPSFTKHGHLVPHKRNQWAHNDAYAQLICQRVGSRDCEMPFQEVKCTAQSGKAQRLPFAGWLRNENIPTLLEELPNRLILIARRCSVLKCQKSVLDGIARALPKHPSRQVSGYPCRLDKTSATKI